MAKWKPDFVGIYIDLKAARNDVFKQLRKFNEEAGQRWIKVAVDSSPIPTWSGASRATFQELAYQLGTTVPIGPIKAPNSGVNYGRRAGNKSKIIEDLDKAYIGFRYQSSLRHLNYNEYNSPTPGPYPQPYSKNVRFTPYFFQVRASDAWKTYARTVKLNNPWKYLKQRPLL